MVESKAKEVTLNDIRKIIYDNEKKPLDKYNEVKDNVDALIKKAWQAENWDELEELQAHMENLLMECVDAMAKDKTLEGTLNTLFVKYDYVNKYNISVINKDTDGVIVKGRIKSLDNVKTLKKLGFYERRSTL